MTAREVLDGIRGRLTAATPGEWWTPSRVAPAEVFSGAGLGNDRCVAEGMEKPDAEFIAAAPADVARLLALAEGVLAVADRMKSEAENAEHGARAAAEINDGAGLRAWESEKYVYQQAERLIRAAIEAAWKEGE